MRSRTSKTVSPSRSGQSTRRGDTRAVGEGTTSMRTRDGVMLCDGVSARASVLGVWCGGILGETRVRSRLAVAF